MPNFEVFSSNKLCKRNSEPMSIATTKVESQFFSVFPIVKFCNATFLF